MAESRLISFLSIRREATAAVRFIVFEAKPRLLTPGVALEISGRKVVRTDDLLGQALDLIVAQLNLQRSLDCTDRDYDLALVTLAGEHAFNPFQATAADSDFLSHSGKRSWFTPDVARD
jgi:hypothetical protein